MKASEECKAHKKRVEVANKKVKQAKLNIKKKLQHTLKHKTAKKKLAAKTKAASAKAKALAHRNVIKADYLKKKQMRDKLIAMKAKF